MAENNSAEEAKGAVERQSQEIKGYKTEELKQSLSVLKQVEKAQERITAQISASAEMSRELKELDSLIYKEKQKRISIEQKLSTYTKEERDAVAQLQVKLEDLRKKEKSREDALKEAQKKRAAIRELDVAAMNDALVVQLKAMEAAGVDAAKRQKYYETEQSQINRLLKLNQQEIKRADLEVERRDKILELTQKQILKTEDGISPKQAEILLLEEALKTQEKTLATLEEEAAKRDLINKRIGITGHIAKGAGALLEKMGMSSFINLEKMNAEIAKAALDGQSKWKILGIVGSNAMSAVGKALTDPLFILTSIAALFTGIVKAALSFEKHAAEASKNLGIQLSTAKELTLTFEHMAMENEKLGMSGKQLMETYTKMNETLGFMGDQNEEFLVTSTGLQRRLGLTANDMSNIAVFSLQTKKSTADTFNSVVGTAKAQMGKLKFAMSEKQVMEGISKASATVFMNFKGNVAQLGAAVVKATKFGTTLDEINSAGKSMLDFESSISKEFEAQLLTGKNINLSKAREYALTGQTDKLMDEITKNIGSQQDYMKMNVIQQESLAESMGMSKQQLDEMFKKQQLAAALGKSAGQDMATQYKYLQDQGKSHKEIAEIMGQQSAQEALQATNQEKMASAQERLAEIVQSIAAKLLPIMDKFTDIITNIKGGFTFVLNTVKAIASAFVGLKTAQLAFYVITSKQVILEKISAGLSQAKEMYEKRGLLLAKAQVGLEQVKLMWKNRQAIAEKAYQLLGFKSAATASAEAGAKAAAGSGWAGPAALGIGLAVTAGLMTMVGALTGMGGGGGGGGAPSARIEPTNPALESAKKDSGPKSMSRSGSERAINNYVYVEPVTGKAISKTANQEYHGDYQKIHR